MSALRQRAPVDLVAAVVAAKLGGGRVHRDRDAVGSGRVAGVGDRRDDDPQDLLGFGEVRGEAALVAEAGGMPGVCQPLAQRRIHLGAGADRLRDGRRPQRSDHELLEVQRVRGVGTAVEHVEARDGQPGGRADAGQPRVQGRSGDGGERAGQRHRDAR